MSELAFSIDKSLSEREGMLIIKIEEVEREGYFLNFIRKNRSYTAECLKKLTTAKDKDSLDFLIQEELRYQKNLQGRTPNLTQFSFEFIHIPYSQSVQVLKLLSVTGKLCFRDKQLACDFFSPNPFFFHVEKLENRCAKVQGRLQMKEKDFDIKECDFICGGTPHHWFIKGIFLKLITTEVGWKDLKNSYSGDSIFSSEKMEELIHDQHHNPLSPKIIFNENTKEAIEQQKDPLPLLILKDRTGAFADLWMDYGEKNLIPMHDTGIKISNKRQLKAENSWEKDLLETDFIKKTVGNSHYYCPLDKVAKSVGFLLELGWQIQDWKGCKVVNQSCINLEMGSDSQAIVVKGKIKYAEFEANLSQVAGAFNRKERFLEIAPGIVGLIPQTWENRGLNGLIEDGEIIQDGLKIPKSNLGTLSDIFNSSLQLTVDPSLNNLRENLKSFQEIKLAPPSASFHGELRPYQQEGVNWLSFLYEYGLNGILADDMGLGKTVQVLAFLSRLTLTEPVLIVVPTSLIFNWKNEIHRFLPHLNVIIHHGLKRTKTEESLAKGEIVLTSYTTLRLDLSLFSQIPFQYIILDEAQNIKNSHTQAAQAVYCLKADHRLSITGTPIENHLQEIWSHFRFLMPELLGDENSFSSDLQAAAADSRYLQRIKKKIRPFVLRRKKEDVAKDLPERIEQIVWVEMEAEQRQFYNDFLAGIKGNLFKKVEADGISKHRMEIFEALLRLRQICCHPLLISSQTGGTLITDSGKTEALLEDLETVIEEGRKALVYSQFTSMLGLIAKAAREKGWKFVYLDGSTVDREKVVTQFQEDPSISLFLISLKAGGIGLNLTAADYVFLYDPWWNEAIENQAINRAHRIGRKDTVIAKRYVVVESIEEKIMRLKNVKQALITDILDDEMSNLNLTPADFFFLLED